MSPTCIITGASRGLGAHLARRFWKEGYNLALVGRDLDKLQALSSEFSIEIDSQNIVLLPYDLCSGEQIAKLISRINQTFSQVDVLINNAAIQGPIGPLVSNDMLSWHNVLQVNLLAPVVLCHAVIPLMREAGGGSIINLSGGGATGPRPNFSAYATAKAGLVRFSETLAAEVSEEGIKVNCIAPGAMKTSMLKEVLQSIDTAGDSEIAVARRVFNQGGASMDAVSDLAVFLASSKSDKITGKLISAVWDKWNQWPSHIEDLTGSDLYTLRRITGRDRGFNWGDW